MKKSFEILLNMKTLHGLECYGSFLIGGDEAFAKNLYWSLQGDDQLKTNSVITIELIIRENAIPLTLALRHCSYDQLGCNIKIITREVFKQLNLENGPPRLNPRS